MTNAPMPGHQLYRLEWIHVPGKFLAAKTSTGEMAAMIFTTRERAQQFLDAKDLAEECKFTATDPQTALAWLRTVLKAGEASTVAIDPDPALIDQTPRCRSIFGILVFVEGRRKDPWWVTPPAD